MNKKIIAQFKVLELLLDAIPENGIPNGHIYAHLMGVITLDMYNSAFDVLKKLKAVDENGYYFTRGENYSKVVASIATQLKGAA